MESPVVPVDFLGSAASLGFFSAFSAGEEAVEDDADDPDDPDVEVEHLRA